MAGVQSETRGRRHSAADDQLSPPGHVLVPPPPLTADAAESILLKYTPDGLRRFASLEQMSISLQNDLLRLMYAVPSLSAGARTHPLA